MSYQVLARKWRPRTFPEMVGQEHVLRALIHALDEDRLHHAFLFTGTRGVGKTTVARILAKSLNCERGVGSTPCGECEACRDIDAGRFVDLIEVDAASRTKVEDTRELLDNVQYTPSRGRYKVYLIDEVHMLSANSFNALLKTLEEPPPHVKFLLATTDPQKLPATILSRCLQFSLKRLPLEPIRGHLERILGAEGIEAEPAALVELARAADGSMRDALSLLDQAIAFGGGRLVAADVREMLGSVAGDRVFELLRRLAEGDAPGLLASCAALHEQAVDYAAVLAELNSVLHRIALAQAVPEALSDETGDRAAVLALAEAIAPEDVQLYYQIGVTGRRDLPLAPDPRIGFEMTLLRMLAFRPDVAGSAPPAASGGGEKPTGGARAALDAARGGARATSADAAPARDGGAVPPRPRVQRSARAALEAAQREAAPPPPAEPEPASAAPTVAEPVAETETGAEAAAAQTESWESLCEKLPLTGITREVAAHCVAESMAADEVRLVLAEGQRHLYNARWEANIAEALTEHWGRAVKVRLRVGQADARTPRQRQEERAAQRLAEATRAIEDDPQVKALLERFDGRIERGSIRPADG